MLSLRWDFLLMGLGHEPYGSYMGRVINKDQGRSPGSDGTPCRGVGRHLEIRISKSETISNDQN